MVADGIVIANGLTSLIVSIVSIITGIKLILKYFQYREKVLLFSGITWLLMYEGWWAPSISFIMLLITDQTLPIEMFFLISMSLIPIAITFWMVACTELMYKKAQKMIIIIFLIQATLFELFSMFYLYFDPSAIIISVGVIDAEYRSFVILYLIGVAILLIITAFLFGRGSFKLDKPEIRLKGWFLLIGFTLLIAGSILDVFLKLEIITLIFYRSLLVLSSIAFYFGFFLPKQLKRIFLKN